MFKEVGDTVWAFDLEWVPDPTAGRRVYNLPQGMTDEEVLQEMWQQGGATEQEPRPYLKTVLCRIVSVAAVCRTQNPDNKVSIALTSLPKNPYEPIDEKELIERFLRALGQAKPQLVGFNSSQADLPILLQRGIAIGVTAPDFCKRPKKPWDGVDYFHSYGDYHVDLKEIVGGWGKATPSLHEMAQTSGIPGKIETDGRGVIDLWLAGKVRHIVEYNQCDALTTYLLWLRTAYFAGFFSLNQYESEQAIVKQLLKEQIAQGESHLSQYLKRWEELQQP